MSAEAPRRRDGHVEMPVTYAAVGATSQADIVRFPPEGTSSYEERVRLGSGQPRFLTAASTLMTWGAHRGAGATVEVLSADDHSAYNGPSFAADGTPALPGAREEQFAADGTPYLGAGSRARIALPGEDAREVLVIYTIDEPKRAGFAWGTADEDGVTGEQLFYVELRDDETVWAVGRGFLTAPKSGLLGRKSKAAIAQAIEAVELQLRSLLPGGATTEGE